MIKKIKLPNVTLLAASSVEIDHAQDSLKISSFEIEFASIKLLSSEKPACSGNLSIEKKSSECQQLLCLTSVDQDVNTDLTTWKHYLDQCALDTNLMSKPPVLKT